MNPIKYFIFFFISLLIPTIKVLGQNPIVINQNDFLTFGKHVEYLIDTTNKLEISDLGNAEFKKFDKEIVNFGGVQDRIWMRFSVVSQTEKELLLEIKSPMVTSLKVFKVDSNQNQQIFSGSLLDRYNQRSVEVEHWVINLKLNSSGVSTFYIQAQSIYPLQLPMSLSSKSRYIVENRYHSMFWGIYLGIIIFALIYNFFIFLSVRERIYFYYLIYILTSALFYLGVQGFGTAFLWPNLPIINLYLPSLICLTNVVILLFALRFLQVTKKQKVSYYFGIFFIATYVLIIIINLSHSYLIAITMAQVFSMITAIYYIILGIGGLIRKVLTARFFLLGWTLFLIFAIIGILAANNVLPNNLFTINCIFIGHMTEVLLLSFALADRINWLKTENDNKQQEIILRMRENDALQLKVNLELEEKVSERTAELKEQRDRSDQLLLNILPYEVAEELKTKGHADAKYIETATVMFTDFKGFTQISEKLTPQGLVSVINECFSEFDRIIQKYGIEKIKTIGDSYMAAGGLPSANNSHAKDVVNACIEIQEFMEGYKSKREAAGEVAFEARIGVHTGPVVAGIVGVKKFAYDIWGDTVNTASRMENSGIEGKVNISETTYNLVKDDFDCIPRGEILAKGKGKLKMYFVNGRKQS